MEAVAPSPEAVAVLRGIARAGFRYEATKELCRAAGWQIVDDELDLGYVAFQMDMVPGQNWLRRLAVEVCESGRPARAFVALFWYEGYEVGREPFDLAFYSYSAQLAGVLGPPSSVGQYSYPHRDGWQYLYSLWALPDATLVLVQDEFDIQFGMDVTLWVLPSQAMVEVPVSGE